MGSKPQAWLPHSGWTFTAFCPNLGKWKVPDIPSPFSGGSTACLHSLFQSYLVLGFHFQATESKLAEQSGKWNFPEECWTAYRIPSRVTGKPEVCTVKNNAPNPAQSQQNPLNAASSEM